MSHIHHGEPLTAECAMCGEMVFDHPAVVECFETFDCLLCEDCAEEALEEEAADMAKEQAA